MIEKTLTIKCDKCSHAETFDTDEVAIAYLRAMRLGWHISEFRHLCERCVNDYDKADNDLV